MNWPNLCVILLNWNGKNDTIECLHSVRQSDYKRFSAIVVDNGSTDGSVEAIRAAHPQTPIMQTGKNLGFAGGNNVGLEWALSKKFEWIFLLNNDTTIAPDCLSALVKRAKAHPNAPILGAKILRMNDRSTIDHLGGKWDPAKGEFDSLHSGEQDGPFFSEPVDYVCGAALFMHRSVPETIGLLEEKFFLFWEETDFCFRARRKGFEVWTAPEARVWHKVSASFVGGKPHSHYFWWRSRLLWLERNLVEAERRELLRKVIHPELWKLGRHYLLRAAQNQLQRCLGKTPTPEQRQKVKRLKAGLCGALDYYLQRFGNCPRWISNAKTPD